MTRLYLIRHAHADWSPDEQRPLSAQGQRDAARVAAQLAPLLANRPLAAIYASPYRRAIETVQPLASLCRLAIETDDDLRERHLGRFDGAFAAAVAATWRDPHFRHANGESNAEAQARGLRVLRAILARHVGQAVAIGTHGNLMALLMQAFDPSIGFDFWQALSMPDVYELRLDAAGRGTFVRVWHDSAVSN